MATELASAYVSVVMESRTLSRQIQSEIGKTVPAATKAGTDSGKRFSGGFLGSIKGLATGVGGALAAAGVIKFFSDSVGAASDLNEQGTKLNQIFGKEGAAALQQFAGQGAKALGQSKLDVLEAAGTFGVYGKAAGLSGEANAKFASGFAGLATDLASFHNANPDEVVLALGSALRGEAEPMRRFGVLLDDASLREEALKQGLIKTTKEALTPQQKVLAAQALIYRQTKDAQGDFARTSGGLANQQRILSAEFQDAKASIGEALLPVMTKLFTYANETAIPAIKGLITEFKNGTGTGGQIRDVLASVGDVLGFLGSHMKAVSITVGTLVAGMLAWKAAVVAKNVVDAVQLTLLKAHTVGTLQHTVVSKTAAAAARIWAAGQWVLNAAMTANPIGLVIAAIVGLVAIFVLAYKKSDTFRAIVQAAWAGIKAAALAVVGWFRDTAWPWLRGVWDSISKKASQVKTDLGIAWGQIKSVFSTTWNWIKTNVIDRMVAGFQWVVTKAVAFKDANVRAFNLLKDGLRAAWNWIDTNVFAVFRRGLDRLKEHFGTVKDAIGRTWDGLKNLAKSPIRFIIDTVLNKGLIAGFNWLSGKIGGPRIDPIRMPSGFAAGGVLPGYTPGRDVHRFFNPRLGFLDLSGGEGILRPEATRALGGKAGIDAINSAARSGRSLDVHAHAGGGIIDWIKSKASSAFAWVSDKASDVFRAVTNPLAFLRGKLPTIPGGKTISAYGKAVVDKSLGLGVQKIKDLWATFQKGFDSLGGVPGSGNAARTVSELTAAVKRILPDTIITSGYRPGSITALGNVSQHSKGLAIDFVPHSVSRFRKVKNAFPNAYQLFYSPADGETLLNGRPWRMDSTTKSGHWDHIHLSNKRYADGGVIPKPLLFDRGGVLPQGLSLVRNATGAPEPLIPADRDPRVIQVIIPLDDLAKLRTLEDFLARIDQGRVDQRKALSGRVSG